MKKTGIAIAVVTDSALIRGVARAVGFLGVNVQLAESAGSTSP
jgi:2,3-bisphosphoglycerate-independent phosphoglycerate mutase